LILSALDLVVGVVLAVTVSVGLGALIVSGFLTVSIIAGQIRKSGNANVRAGGSAHTAADRT
jgi:acyl dehydratase